MKKRILSLFMALVMALSLVPGTAWAAAEGETKGKVHVIVENTTYSVAEDGAPWDGVLVDKWVALDDDSTAMSCVVDALGDYSQSGADKGYISEINGLAERDGGAMSGWMGTLNDWFTSEGFSAFTVKNGNLAVGDEIRIMYTRDYGEDLGGSWYNNDKTVKDVTFSAGTLSEAFDKDVHAYTLTVPAEVSSVVVTPTASNKNFQVRTSVDGVEYKRTASVPVANGKVITVKCGDPGWPSMNKSDGEAQVYTFTVKQEGDTPVPPVAEPQDVTFKGLHDSQLKYLKVYRVGEDVNLLQDVERAADGYRYKYETKLLPGEYRVDGYDANDDLNGSLTLTVKEGENVFNLQRANEIYATNSGWVDGTDYTVSVKVTDADGNNLRAVTGKADNYGTIRTSCLFLEDVTFSVTLTPIGNKAAGFLPVSKTVTTKIGDGAKGISAKIPQALDVTVTAPVGSTVQLGVFESYYEYTFVDAKEVIAVSGGLAEYSFQWPENNSNNCFVRVQHPDGVTYWDFGKWTNGQKISVTAEDLHIGDSNFTKDAVYRFDKNTYDLGNIYLTVNRQGYKNVDVGQSFELNAFRNWQAIESYSNKQIALPDMHYQIIDVNGNPSDILTVTPDANNSGLASVTANKAGTAIVLVTYDAMTHNKGLGGTAFSAIWPEFTGVFVVTVGLDGTNITTNTFIDRPGINVTKDEQKYLDAEHDILFYFGDEGAEYSFKPEDGCTVTVARSTVGDKMTFNGFTSSGVAVAADGTVTVTGLTTGRHIIRVEKNGVASYQVVTARGVSYDLLDADGNPLSADAELKPGQKVKLQFHNVVSPKEKLAGVYNHNFSLYYQDEEGTSFKSNPGSNFGAYDFSGNPARQLIEITIPADYEGLAYELTGAIHVGAFAGIPTHRGASYRTGMDRQYGTSTAGRLAQLPALTFKLEGYAAFYGPIEDVESLIDAIGVVALSSGDRINAARTAYDALSDAQKKEVSNYDVLTAAEARYEALNLENIYTSVGESLQAQVNKSAPIVGSIGGEWLVIDLARSGRTVPAGYYDNVLAYVKANADANERLDRSRSTDNSRVILALTAIGKDVTNVGGHDLLKGLDNMAYIQKQGINGPVWALIALDSYDYTPLGDVTREKLVQTILNGQMDNGGWTLDNKAADVDMTAMAVQSLAPYYGTDAAVKAAVDKALEFLSSAQGATGDYTSSETCAQVIVALTALNIDPTADSRFIKNGVTVLDALCSYYAQDDTLGKGFAHVKQTSGGYVGGAYNQMATEQAYYALAAYYRLINKQNTLYDMTDVTIICAVHTFGTWTVAKAATCTEDGSRTRTCTVCGAVETETIKALGHSLTAVAAKAATCTEAGNSAHWDCARCGKSFSDAAAKTEIAKDSWVIAALGHDEATRAAVAATCYASGHGADTYCKRCDLVLVAGATIPATGKHTYVNGICAACGVKNPAADVKSDSIKVDSKNDKTAAGGGLVVKSDNAITDKVLIEIKTAVDSGSITVTVNNTPLAQATKEQKAADGGKSALTEAAKNASDEVKQELTKLAEKLDALRGDSSRKNAQIEKVVDVTVELVKSVNDEIKSVAQLIELPHSVTVTIPITDELYAALQGKRVCVVRSHTDVNGSVTTAELSATLGGTKGNYVLTFQTDKASTFAIVSYETVSTGGGGSHVVNKPTSASTADDSQMVLWLGSAMLAAAGVVVLSRKKRAVR